MSKYSDWRTDLREVMDDDTDDRKVSDKKVNNAKLIKINPKLGEAVEELGGQIIEMKEVDDADDKIEKDDDAEKKAKMADKVKKKEAMLKKRIVRMKMMAVNQGAADSIVAGYEPEGEVIDEAERSIDDRLERKRKLYKKTTRKAMDYARREGEAAGHARYRMSSISREIDKLAAKKNVNEGVMKFIKSVGKKPEKKAQKATDAGARARRKLQQKDQEKVNFLPMDEAKVDTGRSDYGKASIRNYRRSGPGHGEPAMFDPENKRGKLIDKRREEHKERRGVKGAKVPAYKVNEEDKAFNFVLDKIKKEVGKSGYVSKNNPRKPQSPADKAKVRAHQAKVDAENAAERKKDPSQGRYPKG